MISNKIKHPFLKSLVICGFLILCSFKLGPIRVGGWVGDKLDKGIFGTPMDLATAGTINNLHDKLDDNINHLDAVMAKNAKAFTDNLQSVLAISERKLDTVLSKDIEELHTAINDNILKLDQATQQNLGGLTYQQNFFNKTLWVTVKLSGYIGLFILTICFIFITYNHLQTTGSLDKPTLLILFRRTRFYLIMFLACFFIILVFPPLASGYVNDDYNRQIEKYERALTSNLQNLNINSAMYNADYLTRLSNGNKKYDYGFSKVKLARYFLSFSNEKTPNEESPDDLYNDFTGFYEAYGKNDPEFYILSALYHRKYYDSKFGLLIAAIDCIKYAEAKARKSQTDLYKMGLEPYAKNILDQYFLNPYDHDNLIILIEKLKDLKISVSDYELKALEIDNVTQLEIVDSPILSFKSDLYYFVSQDQDLLYKYLSENNKDTVKKEIFTNWAQQIKISDDNNAKLLANEALGYNDFIPYALLKDYTSPEFAELNAGTQRQVDNLDLPQPVKDSINRFFVFKKLILVNVIKNTNDKFASGMKIKMSMSQRDYFQPKIDSLLSITDTFLKSDGQSDFLSKIETCIKLSAKLDLYYRRVDIAIFDRIRRPLAYYYIDLVEDYYHDYYQAHQDYKIKLKDDADKILETSYYSQ